MTSEDVRNVTFEKSMRGYRSEDVDDFLQMIAGELEDLAAEKEAIIEEKNAALADKASIQNKIYVLAQKVEEYRGQEETLKTALINAQRMGETVVHEAKQKADALVREATGKAELLRQQAEEEIALEKLTLEKMKEEVARFKATILNLYKQHIESLSALDAPAAHAEEYLQEFENSYKDDAVYKSRKEMQSKINLSNKEPENVQTEENIAPPVMEHVKPVQPEAPAVVSLFEGVPIEYDQN